MKVKVAPLTGWVLLIFVILSSFLLDVSPERPWRLCGESGKDLSSLLWHQFVLLPLRLAIFWICVSANLTVLNSRVAAIRCIYYLPPARADTTTWLDGHRSVSLQVSVCATRFCYTRNQLLFLKPARLTPDIIGHLRRLGVGSNLPRKRTRRGGRKQRKIAVLDCDTRRRPTFITTCKQQAHEHGTVNFNNLIIVPVLPSDQQNKCRSFSRCTVQSTFCRTGRKTLGNEWLYSGQRCWYFLDYRILAEPQWQWSEVRWSWIAGLQDSILSHFLPAEAALPSLCATFCGQTTDYKKNKRAPIHYIIPINDMVHRPL